MGREDYVNEKFQLHHRESNPRGSPPFRNKHFTLPAYFPSGRKPFELKRLVIFGFVYRKQLPHSMNSTSAVLCFLLPDCQKCFLAKHVLRTIHDGKHFSVFFSNCFILHCWYLRDQNLCNLQKKYKK